MLSSVISRSLEAEAAALAIAKQEQEKRALAQTPQFQQELSQRVIRPCDVRFIVEGIHWTLDHPKGVPGGWKYDWVREVRRGGESIAPGMYHISSLLLLSEERLVMARHKPMTSLDDAQDVYFDYDGKIVTRHPSSAKPCFLYEGLVAEIHAPSIARFFRRGVPAGSLALVLPEAAKVRLACEVLDGAGTLAIVCEDADKILVMERHGIEELCVLEEHSTASHVEELVAVPGGCVYARCADGVYAMILRVGILKVAERQLGRVLIDRA